MTVALKSRQIFVGKYGCAIVWAEVENRFLSLMCALCETQRVLPIYFLDYKI